MSTTRVTSNEEPDTDGVFSLVAHSRALEEGELFSTFQDFKARLHSWAAVAGFAVRFERSDRKKNFVVCKASKECTFKVHAYWKPKLEKVQVTKVVAAHTVCLGAAKPPRDSVSQRSFLKTAVPKLLPITQTTTPKQIQDAVQMHLSRTIKYRAAYKVLKALQNRGLAVERSLVVIYSHTVRRGGILDKPRSLWYPALFAGFLVV
jgi:hypothetical protein